MKTLTVTATVLLALCVLFGVFSPKEDFLRFHASVHDAPGAPVLGSPLPLIGIAALPVALLCGYDIVTEHMLTEYERQLPHDPETGLMYDAEPCYLGPLDSPRAVLLVHGFVGAGSNFNRLPDELAKRGWRVRVMLLPGHGTTPRNLEQVTADSLITSVRDELALLRKTHGTVAIIGHSMGGALAAIVASEGGVDRLVLCAPYFAVTHKWYYFLKPETWVDITKPVVRWVRKTDDFIQVNRREAIDQIVSYEFVPVRSIDVLNEIGERSRGDDVLGRISCPVLMLHGRGDEAASFEVSRRAFESIGSTDKRFITFERSNHHLFFDYERDEVVGEIIRFLDTDR